ncbi:AAA family ATPase [Achromobacter insolitus]|uniref:AAA family ATPase n=1 Tax=Achromobacter insolitus TaxID=217204 RepID=UPI001E4F3786|nr:AAA family ATPase [Achromobacter insolitus]
MKIMTSLDDLGPRICILGPSNSGKSTLAQAISRKRGLDAVHLDRLFHTPNTNWLPRSEAEFILLHDQAIQQDCWVMEGNYTRTLSQRLKRSTGLILLDSPTSSSLLRYFRRTWFETNRRGALDGGRDSVKWRMIYHIAVVTPKNRRRYAQMFENADLPKLKLRNMRELRHFYRVEKLAA